VGEPFRRNGHEVIAVDIDGKCNPDIVCDILEWHYNSLPWVPDILWSSPPCTEYSIAKTRGIRNLELADSIVNKFIEIRDYFLTINPNMLWFCENGASTHLWNRGVAATLYPRVTLSYCQYDGPGYQKNTTIATNAPWVPRPLCNLKTCKQVRGGRHLRTAQKGPTRDKEGRRPADHCSLNMLHRLPHDLCDEIYHLCLGYDA
jgi:hypothetical protein